MNIRLLNLFFLVAFSFVLAACSDEDTGSYEKYGDGSPHPENIVQVANYRYELNAQGLVEKMYHQVKENEYDENTGQTHTTMKEYLVAEFRYPQYNRAVMYSDDGSHRGEINYNYPTSFAFGANGFAYKFLEKDEEGQYLTKIDYNDEGYITRYDKGYGDILKLEWNNGNIAYRIDKTEDGIEEFRYTPSNRTDFANYNIDPFLADFTYSGGIGWWFEPYLIYAWYAGFMGHPNKNLPAMVWEKNIYGSELSYNFEYKYYIIDNEYYYWIDVTEH